MWGGRGGLGRAGEGQQWLEAEQGKRLALLGGGGGREWSWKLSGGERWLHKCVGRTELTQGPLDLLCGGGSAYRAERRGRVWHLSRSDWALLEQEPLGLQAWPVEGAEDRTR